MQFASFIVAVSERLGIGKVFRNFGSVEHLFDLKWSCSVGQFSGFAKKYPLVDHAAIFSFSPAKNAWSGVRFSRAVWGRLEL